MKKFSLLLMVGAVGSVGLLSSCGKSPQGLLGKCTQEVPGIIYPGEEYCADYSFETNATKDITADALAAAKETCGSGTWTDNEACSTTLGTATGYCKFSITKTSGSESYTLNYRAVFGPALLAGSAQLQAWCEGLNEAPLTATWSTSP